MAGQPVCRDLTIEPRGPRPQRMSFGPGPVVYLNHTCSMEQNRVLFSGAVMQLLKRIWNDDNGGEVIEYALIAGLIIVTAIAVITAFGTKVLARWSSVNSSL